MNKEARWIWVLFVAVLVALAGCAHKPAYSEMDASRASTNQNQNQNRSNDAQVTPSEPAPGAASPTEAAQPAAAPSTAFKNPSFMDQAKGDIKDLPGYPRSYRVSAQIGPLQGVNTMSLGLRSSDPMDKIAAYYERVIKENKWTVIDKIVDPEFSEWNLKKGEADSAKVQIRKDPQSNAMNIVIVRGERSEGASK